ncbi:germ cell nuclear acidic protein isoform X1 [Scyliorhinus torazame]|uniref:germ cell nuclear acidic protein isoform X1 n=1 Tax=Scyliorhinus torazame TaxID=75743 RepID=UPI003B5C8AD9
MVIQMNSAQMDEETRSLFQRVAGRLGWTQHGGLNAIEAQLQERIKKSKQPVQDNCEDAAINLESETEESPNTCDSCVCKLLLSSSEDEAELSPKITPGNRQEECALTNKVGEKLQNHCGTIVISDSDDDDIEICVNSDIIHTRPLNTDSTSRCISRTKTKRPDYVSELSTDSSADENYEKFLMHVKTLNKSQKHKACRENDDCLKDFIVSDDSSLDELDINGIVETEQSADNEQPEPIRRNNVPVNECSVEAIHTTPTTSRSMVSLSNNTEDYFVKSLPIDRLLDKRKKKRSEQQGSCTSGMLDSILSTEPMGSEAGNSSNHPIYSKQLNEMSDPSDTSSDDFESVFQRIKNKTLRTPALTSSKLNGRRMVVTEPVKRKPCSNTLGKKRKPTAKIYVPIDPPPSKPMKGVLSEFTSLSQVPDFSNVFGSRSEHGVSQKCLTPGCFLQDLTLSSSKYVKNFKQNREELTQELYNLYNESVFQQKLPEKLVITWNKKMRKTAGYCVTGQKRDGILQRYARIELSEKVCDSAERLRDTLIHELCHAATWLINNVRDGHGPFWKLYAQKSILIHPELPMVTRCHTYEINYKYTYQCSKCKNMIGRHSKSLDTQRFVCALCTGPLVLLTSMLKDGTPAKKDLAPFAKFVKENYGSTKKEHKGLQHAEVMRKLSADFAKMTHI